MRVAIPLALLLGVAACGGRAVARVPRDCTVVGKAAATTYALCAQRKPHGQVLALRGSSRGIVPLRAPGATPSASAAGRVGHWAWAALSPDGRTLLVQWSAECEALYAFVVPAAGGAPRSAAGETDWAKAPYAITLGWTTGGRAVVAVPAWTPCGSARRPGVWLVDAQGAATRVRDAAWRQRRSVAARPASAFAARGRVADLWAVHHSSDGRAYEGRVGSMYYRAAGDRVCAPSSLLRLWSLRPSGGCALVPDRPRFVDVDL